MDNFNLFDFTKLNLPSNSSVYSANSPASMPASKPQMPVLGFGGVSNIKQFYPSTNSQVSPQVLSKLPQAAQNIQNRPVIQPPVQNSIMDSVIPTANASFDEQKIQDFVKFAQGKGLSKEKINEIALKAKNAGEFDMKTSPTVASTEPKLNTFAQVGLDFANAYVKPIQILGNELVAKPINSLIDWAMGREQDPSNKYHAEDIAKIGNATIGATFNAIAPLASAALNTANTIPGVNNISQGLGKIIETGGNIINKLPGLSTFRETLATPEDQQAFDSFVGSLGLMGGVEAIGKVKGKTTPEIIQAYNELPTKIGGKIAKIPGKIGDVISTAGENMSTKFNRLDPSKEVQFSKMTGESVGEFLTKRGINTVKSGTVSKTAELFQQSIAEADKGFNAIDGTFKMKGGRDYVQNALDDLKAKAIDTRNDSLITQIDSMESSYMKGGLDMTSLNDLKRLYQNNFKFGYLAKDITPNVVEKATNTLNGIREFQFKVAKENGFDNIAQINKNTQAYKFISDNLENKINKQSGNNAVSLTDWILLSGEHPSMLIGKAIGKSELFKTGVLKTLNAFKNTKEPLIKAPIKNISNINAQKYASNLMDTTGNNSSNVPRLNSPTGEVSAKTVGVKPIKLPAVGKLLKTNQAIEGKVGIKPGTSFKEGATIAGPQTNPPKLLSAPKKVINKPKPITKHLKK